MKENSFPVYTKFKLKKMFTELLSQNIFELRIKVCINRSVL